MYIVFWITDTNEILNKCCQFVFIVDDVFFLAECMYISIPVVLYILHLILKKGLEYYLINLIKSYYA